MCTRVVYMHVCKPLLSCLYPCVHPDSTGTYMHTPHTRTHAILYIVCRTCARAQRLSRRDDWFPSHYPRSLSLSLALSDIFSLPSPDRSSLRMSIALPSLLQTHFTGISSFPRSTASSLSPPDLFFPTQFPAQ